MSGQRSSSYGGTAASVAAGCTLRESSSPSSSSASSRNQSISTSISPLRRPLASPQQHHPRLEPSISGSSSSELSPSSQPLQPSSSPSSSFPSRSSSQHSALAVFSWGRGEDGQLGLGDTSDQDVPAYIDALRGIPIQKIACGSGHTVVLTTDGLVYTWGRGDDGRLGHGDNGWKYVPRVTQILAAMVVRSVTCGSYHTAAVAGRGDLYTWGGGMYGKLGHGDEIGHSAPTRVQSLGGKNVEEIACGSRHTAVVAAGGRLYTWGDKENGVAGHGDTGGHQYTPKLLEKLKDKKIVQLSACGFHTACLTEHGEVYTWGEGKFGRLGHGGERNCHGPRLVEALMGKRPIQVACGGFHTAVITNDGHMYTFGGGEHGQLGHGDKVNKVKPTRVAALETIHISQITCGWSHSVALTSKGGVYTWGNGDHGKLGHGSGKKVSMPSRVEKLRDYRVVRVASYNEHTAALVEPLGHHRRWDSRRENTSLMSGPSVPVTAGYMRDMKEMVNDDEYSDVVFCIDEDQRRIHAHRGILAKRSEHFAAMFRSGMRESVEREVRVTNISYHVFLLIMEYLYTDGVKIDLDHAVDLYVAADLYQLNRLKDMCTTVVQRHLNGENAAILLQSADNAHCNLLKEICMDYIVTNFDTISKSNGIKVVSHGLLLEILSLRP